MFVLVASLVACETYTPPRKGGRSTTSTYSYSTSSSTSTDADGYIHTCSCEYTYESLLYYYGPEDFQGDFCMFPDETDGVEAQLERSIYDQLDEAGYSNIDVLCSCERTGGRCTAG